MVERSDLQSAAEKLDQELRHWDKLKVTAITLFLISVTAFAVPSIIEHLSSGEKLHSAMSAITFASIIVLIPSIVGTVYYASRADEIAQDAKRQNLKTSGLIVRRVEFYG